MMMIKLLKKIWEAMTTPFISIACLIESERELHKEDNNDVR